MPSTAGKIALIRVPGTPTAFTNEAVTTADDQTYQITDITKRVFVSGVPLVVTVNGVTQSTTLYTVDPLRGRVTFTTSTPRTNVRFAGSYYPMSLAAKCRSISISMTKATLDNTGFEDSGWITRLVGMPDVTGSLSRRWQVNAYFHDALVNAAFVVIEFYLNAAVLTSPEIICAALLNKKQLSSVIDGLVEEEVEFSGTSLDKYAPYNPATASLL